MTEAPLEWRLLEDGIKDPFLHFAVEESLLRRVSEGRSRPTLRLRQVVPSVFVGVFQDPREDADVEFCRSRGIPIVRRPNPGGAVYQDEGSFCFSAFFPKHPTFEMLGIHETRELYRLLGDLVVAWCRSYGVEAKAAPVNDVEVEGRKLYGSAQVELGDAVVHSGTFLVHADIAVMEAALRPSRLKFSDKGFTSVRDRVRNLFELIGRPIMVSEAMVRFVEMFEQHLPVSLVPGALTEDERADAESLCRQKYANEEWTFPKRRPFSTTVAMKARSGVVMLDLELDGDRIENAAVHGDFLLERQKDLVDLLARLKGQPLGAANEFVKHGNLPPDLSEALVELLEMGGQRHHGAVP